MEVYFRKKYIKSPHVSCDIRVNCTFLKIFIKYYTQQKTPKKAPNTLCLPDIYFMVEPKIFSNVFVAANILSSITFLISLI